MENSLGDCQQQGILGKMTMMCSLFCFLFFSFSRLSLDLKDANYSFRPLKLSGEDEQKARDLVCHG